jgi:lysophospholipase L1-like esterase
MDRMKIAHGSTLVMIGDSITDCGRDQPPMDGFGDALGTGYVYFVDSLIGAAYPGYRIQILNRGISGNTIRDLDSRWQKDVLDLHPDWLSIMIGINDVWRQFDSFLPPSQMVSIGEYENTLERLVRETRPQLKGLILITPYYVEPDRGLPMRAMMDRYGEAVRALARKYQAVLVDAQAAIDQALRGLSADDLASDRVHMNSVGHMILARAFLKAIDYSW